MFYGLYSKDFGYLIENLYIKIKNKLYEKQTILPIR
jgi:hypothetical protein